MATVSEHIKQLFSGFNLPLNDAALNEIATCGAPVQDEYTEANHGKVMKAILEFAPILMLSPTSYSVSENGHSKSKGFNMDGFLRWYALMCKRYGVTDELNKERPKIKFL
jgi:hypothetical protein